jgi:hypothetical protein
LKETWETADADLREAILRATQLLNRQLATDPQQQGESRDGTTRILFAAPLGVIYQVDEVKRVVHILRTWAYRRSAA